MRYFFALSLLTGILFLLSDAVLWAQDSPEANTPVLAPEEVVVTADRTEKKLEEVTVPVAIISETEIENMNVQSLSDILYNVPGVYVRKGAGIGSSTAVLIRGGHSAHTLVLIDGIEVNDPNFGSQFDFCDLDAAGIERVEIVKGSYSALYGSSAIGGVINVITKKGKGASKLTAETSGGSFDTGRVLVSGNGGEEKSNWSFTASRLQTNNAVPHNSYERETFNCKTGSVIRDGLSLEFLSHVSRSVAEDPYDFGSPLPLDNNITRKRDQYVVGAKLNHEVSSAFSYHVKTSFFDLENVFKNRGDNIGDTEEFSSTCETSVSTVNVQTKFDIAKLLERDDLGWEVIVGGDTKRISTSNFTSPFAPGLQFDDILYDNALYFHNELNFSKRVIFAVGFRYNKYASTKTNFLPRAGIRFNILENTSVKVNYAEGFRSPNPIELFDPYCGNTALTPEKSRSYDAGIEQKFLNNSVKFEATFFKMNIKNLIAYDNNTWLMENYSDAETEGVEIAVTFKPVKGFLVGISFTTQDPRDLSDDSLLPAHARNFGGVKISYTQNKVSYSLDSYFSEPITAQGVLDENGNTQPRAGNAKMINAAFGYKIGESAEITLKLTNLLNSKYKETQVGPYVLPFGAFAGLRINF
ncbi:MAG: TonB-dependent receptor [Planctomycetota bacterium]